MATSRVVVVGAGLAGLRCAETVRLGGFGGEVVLVGDEGRLPYNRPPLSKEALSAETLDEDRLTLRSRALDGMVTRLGDPAVHLDPASATVALRSGAALDYDAVVLACGVRPRRLPGSLWGGTARTSLAVRTVEDARAVRRRLAAGRTVLVLGAGFLGCELASTASALGCEVVMVAPEEAPLERAVGPHLARLLRARLESCGVRLLLGTAVDGVEGGAGARTVVRTTSGSEVAVDTVIEAIGSRPHVDWLAGSGLDLSDGVRTDADMRVLDTAGRPVRGTYAAGDVACFPHRGSGGVPRRAEHWHAAVETGRQAARAVLQDLAVPVTRLPHAWDGVPTFWSDQCGGRLQGAGRTGVSDGVVEHVEERGGDVESAVVVRFAVRGELVGGVTWNAPADALRIRRELAAPERTERRERPLAGITGSAPA